MLPARAGATEAAPGAFADPLLLTKVTSFKRDFGLVFTINFRSTAEARHKTIETLFKISVKLRPLGRCRARPDALPGLKPPAIRRHPVNQESTKSKGVAGLSSARSDEAL